MEPKKSPKADLNNYSSTFILFGLVAMLFLSWRVIELKTYEDKIDIGELNLSGDDEDETLEVKIEDIKLPPPPVQAAPPEEIEVVKDEEDVKEDIVQSSETDDKEEIKDVEDINVDDEPEETDVEVPFQFIQNPPIYPGCESKKGKALKDCMNAKINKFVGRKFNTGIASDLGLSGEKVKILTVFTIGKDGRIINIRARSKYKELQKEAKRVIGMLPRMKPGKQRNMPVKVTFTLPIIFKVEE